MRFHLVDRIEKIKYGEYIEGIRCIALSDDVFNEHFPGYPVYPGSLVLESLAQIGGAYFELMMNKESLTVKRSVLSIINKMKFRKPALPGDRLIIKAVQEVMKEDYGVVKVFAEIDDEICCEGELTFVFIDIKDEKLYESRMQLYKTCMKNTLEV